MEFIGFLSQNMLFRHENVQMELRTTSAKLEGRFSVFILITVNVWFMADVCQRVNV